MKGVLVMVTFIRLMLPSNGFGQVFNYNQRLKIRDGQICNLNIENLLKLESTTFMGFPEIGIVAICMRRWELTYCYQPLHFGGREVMSAYILPLLDPTSWVSYLA